MKSRRSRRRKSVNKWSDYVTKNSDAMDLESKIFLKNS